MPCFVWNALLMKVLKPGRNVRILNNLEYHVRLKVGEARLIRIGCDPRADRWSYTAAFTEDIPCTGGGNAPTTKIVLLSPITLDSLTVIPYPDRITLSWHK